MGIPTEELAPKVHVAIETLMNEVERLRRDLDEVKHQNSHLEKLTDEDSLLPVIDRRAFVREFSRAMSFAQRYSQSSSLAFFDVSNEKNINDELGHTAGDAALMHVAEILLEHVRHSDVVGRLGGNEFGVVLAQADEDAALRKSEELAAAINNQPATWNGKKTKSLSPMANIRSATRKNQARHCSQLTRQCIGIKRCGCWQITTPLSLISA